MKTTLLEPGKYYHIYNRTKTGAPLFRDEEAYRFFLRLYRNHISPVADTYAYCLLRDHIHLLVKIKDNAEGSIYRPFAMLFNAYAKGYNRHHNHEGKLFRFKLKRIEIRREHFVPDMVRYINQNSMHHGIQESLPQYRFSSYRSSVTNGPSLICKEGLIRMFGSGQSLADSLSDAVDESRIRVFMLEN